MRWETESTVRPAEARRKASIMMSSSIRLLLTGLQVDCTRNTSLPRTVSLIETEISPEIGGENASSEILGFLLQGFDGDVEQLWQSNIFGKPIYTIAQEGVEEKLSCLPTKAVSKLQETLQRVVNEGSGTLICIIL